MRKAYKRLPVFFLLFAWMVLTAHQIIPHDHHLSDSLAGKEQKCPVSDSRTDHHKGFPLHCHAFNDLASEKVVKFVLANYIHFTLFSSGSFSYPIHAESQCLTIRVTSLDLPEYHFMDFSSLRAPPSFS
jgi:hypothetical protein